MKRKATPPDSPGKPEPLAPQPSPKTVPPSNARPTTAQVFLGIFILWQMFFLFASNLVGLLGEVRNETSYQKNFPRDWLGVITKTFPDWLNKEGHVHDALNVVKDLTTRWEQLAGQPQGWSLFAPEVTNQITFVAVELRWDDPQTSKARRDRLAPYPPELLLSENEPKDKTRFFRWGKFRLRKYESYLDTVLRVYKAETPEEKDETLEEAVERWEKRIKKKVADEEDNIQAYLKMRCRQFMSKHADRPWPKQVILIVRRFEIPPPKEFSEDWYKDPRDMPRNQISIARCLIDDHEEFGAVQWFRPALTRDNKITGQFLSLRDNAASQRPADDHDNDDDDDD
jgi:hypothetical protein